MNLPSKIVYFYKRKIQPGFRINRKELVVDIGSGDKPFWRADVFFDNTMLSDNQRITGTGAVTSLGLFVNGTLPHTPFQDKAFDFSFCAHLLEHVEDPDMAIKELMRISKRGYIETPNGVLELMDPFRSHLWFIFLNGNKLIFVRKSKKMHETLKANGKRFNKVIKKISDPFIRMYWEGKIDYEIINDLDSSEKFYPVEEESYEKQKYNLYVIFIKMMRKIFYINKERLVFHSIVK